MVGLGGIERYYHESLEKTLHETCTISRDGDAIPL